jgi:hypothetical protein
MAFPALTDADLQEAVDAVAMWGTQKEAARALGFTRGKLGTRLTEADLRGIGASGAAAPAPARDPPRVRLPDFETERLPSTDEPIEDLLNRKRIGFERRKAADEASSLTRVRVNIAGPYGILHMGDPHLDDDGCDIATLERHLELIDRTPGLFAANVGDLSNNWVGRLARLYSGQSATAADAWRLVEWFVRRVRWLYLVGGNHDVWSGAADPVRWFARNADAHYKWHGVRLELTPPSGASVRVNARHDYPGTSQWNGAHAASKAARIGFARDHIYTCGHRHMAAQNMVVFDNGEHIAHAVRVGTYKVFDDYAEARGFPRENLPAAVTIVDPNAKHATGLVRVFWDVEGAADYLRFLRARST